MQRPASPRWIFFDVGYTLLDETPAWDEQFYRLAAELARRGRPTAVETIWQAYRDACRTFAPKQWQAVCAAFARDEHETSDLMTLGDDWRHDLEVPYPGTRDALLALAQRSKLGIIANQSLGTRDRLVQHGLMDAIALVIGSAEAGVSKPDPKIFHAALREAGCIATDAAMVGDRLDNDVRPANLLGMQTVHVKQGGAAAQVARDATETPTFRIAAIADVRDVWQGK